MRTWTGDSVSCPVITQAWRKREQDNLMKPIRTAATTKLLFVLLWEGILLFCPQYVRTTSDIFPQQAQYLWTRGFFKHLCQIFFHWILLHNTNQDQQHSCGCSYIQHIQLQQSWASKSTASPLLSQQMANHGFVGMQWYTRMSVQLLCTSWKYETNWTETSYRWLAVLLNRGYRSVTRTKCLSLSLSADTGKLFWERPFMHSVYRKVYSY